MKAISDEALPTTTWIVQTIPGGYKVKEKRFTIRVRKKDGTAKLLVGVYAAGGFYLGKLIKIPVGKDAVLVAKVTAQPKALNEPWEATQV